MDTPAPHQAMLLILGVQGLVLQAAADVAGPEEHFAPIAVPPLLLAPELVLVLVSVSVEAV